MQVKQIYELMNSVSNEVLGSIDIITEDLTGVVDLGTEIFNQKAVDNYVNSLVNHIGKMVFVDRPYSGKAPTILMDNWEFGSMLQKVSVQTPEATENKSWNLEDKKEYKQDIFYKPKVSSKFFNSKVTFEVPLSITEAQVKESFSNAQQLNGFLTMLLNSIEKSLTIKLDSLIMRTINNMIGETLYADAALLGSPDGSSPLVLKNNTTARCVNLLKLYNDKFGTKLTADNCVTDKDFIRFAVYQLGIYTDRMANVSTLFNVGEMDKFTPVSDMRAVMISDFARAANAYLYAQNTHNEYLQLPTIDTVPFWQGSGKAYDFEDITKLDIKVASGKTVKVSGILAVMFDKEAVGVANMDRRVTSNYNAKAEFFNTYYKVDAGFFNDTNENFVVFFVA